MADIESIALAVARIHGCDNDWLDTVPVRIVARGKTTWQGGVQVFGLIGHTRATRCYAWSEPARGSRRDGATGEARVHAILHVPPIDSPEAAVRSTIADERHGRGED